MNTAELTQEFYAECHKVVLAGIRKGLIVCPPLEKPKKNIIKSTTLRACQVCAQEVEMYCNWQKMCLDCSNKTNREKAIARGRVARAKKKNQL